MADRSVLGRAGSARSARSTQESALLAEAERREGASYGVEVTLESHGQNTMMIESHSQNTTTMNDERAERREGTSST